MFAATNLDAAFLPVDLPFTMTIQQAAEAVRVLQPKVVYPYHSRGSDLNEFERLVGKGGGIEVQICKGCQRQPSQFMGINTPGLGFVATVPDSSFILHYHDRPL